MSSVVIVLLGFGAWTVGMVGAIFLLSALKLGKLEDDDRDCEDRHPPFRRAA